MRKLWTLARKEIRISFRDVGAIVTMLVTPLVLTLAFGAAFGQDANNVLTDIPVLFINQDTRTLSQSVTDALASDEVTQLLTITETDDEASARAKVEAGEVAALIIIPENFSDRAFPLLAMAQQQLGIDLVAIGRGDDTPPLTQEQQRAIGGLYEATQRTPSDAPAIVEIYAGPDRTISTAVIKGVLSQILEQIHMTTQGTTTIMERLVRESALSQDEIGNNAALPFEDLGQSMREQGEIDDLPIQLQIISPSGRLFNWLDYSATSMAILFLMFAVTSGGKTLLAEREAGTLPRLLVSPTPALTVLVGKMAGIVLTGLLQVLVLWGATTLLGAYWGQPLAVFITILVLVLCATGVGALVSAWAKTPGQAGAIGTTITLVASAFSGSYFPRAGLPTWMQTLSLITPNAWGIEIFSILQTGKGLARIIPHLGGALLLTIIYYAVALVGFRRQFD